MDEELEPIETWPVFRSCGASDIGEECLRIQGHIGDHEGEHYSWPKETELCWELYAGDFCQRPKGHENDHSWRPDEDADPNDLGTFGEYLDHYTARGGMTADERTAFWMSWSRHTIAWVFAVAGCLIVKSMYSGLVDMLASAVGSATIVALIWQAVDAVRFAREGRRWKR